MRELVLATNNAKKLAELKRLLRKEKIRILGLSDFKGMPRVEEDRKTFKGNARKKAVEISRRIDKLVMADDSGLEVPALGNAPGVYSARYAGPAQDDDRNIEKLLKDMGSFKGAKRKARFRCVICLSKGRKVISVVEGRVNGRIACKRKGSAGFGYDPVFVPKSFKKTFAQLSSSTKDRISHRAAALKKTKEVILRYFQKCH